MKPRNFPCRRKLRQLRATLREREIPLSESDLELLQLPRDTKHRHGAAWWRRLY